LLAQRSFAIDGAMGTMLAGNATSFGGFLGGAALEGLAMKPGSTGRMWCWICTEIFEAGSDYRRDEQLSAGLRLCWGTGWRLTLHFLNNRAAELARQRR